MEAASHEEIPPKIVRNAVAAAQSTAHQSVPASNDQDLMNMFSPMHKGIFEM